METFAAWLGPWLQSGSPLLIPLVLIGGLATAVNPCCLPMYPAALGYLGQAGLHPEAANKSSHLALAFITGMATATTAMGAATATFGWVFGQIPYALRLLLATMPLVMGLELLGVIRLHLSLRRPVFAHARISERFFPRMSRAFTVGLLFTIAIAPCATPILIGILSVIAMNGCPLYGSALMFVYGLGTGLPLLAMARGTGYVANRLASPQTRRIVNDLLGSLLVVVGLFLIWKA